jgi:hypothetical protein
MGPAPDANATAEGRVYYNDIQCGNGPANTSPDETTCPGRVDLGQGNLSGCAEKGPRWWPSLIGAVKVVDVVTQAVTPVAIYEGARTTIDRSRYPNGFTVVALGDSAKIEHVEFMYDGYMRAEKGAPYVLSGNDGVAYTRWETSVGAKQVTIAAYPSAAGAKPEYTTVTFSVI